jgi:dihydrofolate reductase
MGELEAADAQLLGRVTYEGFAKAWPSMGDNPFGEKMNSMPKFVVSTTLTNADWTNSTILNGDLRGDVTAVKEQFAGDILIAGSCKLVQSLIALDLVDRLNLMVFPILLGSGKRLFADDAQPKTFTPTSARQIADVAVLTYERKDG